jgi:hypothetical protein
MEVARQMKHQRQKVTLGETRTSGGRDLRPAASRVSRSALSRSRFA